jgi:hypothetical protein
VNVIGRDVEHPRRAVRRDGDECSRLGAVAAFRVGRGTRRHYRTGSREVGGTPVEYVLVLKRANGHVVAFEAWGPGKLIYENADALRKSGLSADPG